MRQPQTIYFDEPHITHNANLLDFGALGQGVKVAVLDGAVDRHHPALSATRIVDAYAGHSVPTVHGTAVTSLIAGAPHGLARNCEIVLFPVFEEDQAGRLRGCSDLTLAKTIQKAADLGCHIINVSGGATSSNGQGSSQLRRAVKACLDKDVLIVAATGNDGHQIETVPAAIDGVLAIGASDESGRPQNFNNYGRKLRAKALLAPGVRLRVPAPNNSTTEVTGSSFSTPLVTGLAALMMNVQRQATGQHSGREIIEILTKTAIPCQSSQGEDCARVMSGRVNPPAATAELLARHAVMAPTSALPSNPKRTPNMTETLETKPAEPAAHDGGKLAASNQEAGLVSPMAAPDGASNQTVEAAEFTEPLAVPSSLNLPVISDPAANNHVHAPRAPAASPTPEHAVAPHAVTETVQPQGNCHCPSMTGGEMVFAVGEIGYDFGTEARLDYFTQVMGGKDSSPHDPEAMATHLNLDHHAEDSSALIWTLKIDGIPVYGIAPENQFAVLQFSRLIQFLQDQEKNGVERISIAGTVSGEVKLFNGHVIQTVSPVLRGMFNWKSDHLADAVISAAGGGKADKASDSSREMKSQLTNFLNRIYYELRNQGSSSAERALNYAATNAYQMKEVFEDAFKENLFLNSISATESPVCRPESDCWDVVLEFFDPKERLNRSRKLYRYTIDVSDIMPVTVGSLRSWHAY